MRNCVLVSPRIIADGRGIPAQQEGNWNLTQHRQYFSQQYPTPSLQSKATFTRKNEKLWKNKLVFSTNNQNTHLSATSKSYIYFHEWKRYLRKSCKWEIVPSTWQAMSCTCDISLSSARLRRLTQTFELGWPKNSDKFIPIILNITTWVCTCALSVSVWPVCILWCFSPQICRK